MAAATGAEWAGLAQRREAGAPCQAAATGELGWEPDQGRWWSSGPRQAVTVRLASGVLAWLERPQRRRQNHRGRPRAPFAPAAGSPEAGAVNDD